MPTGFDHHLDVSKPGSIEERLDRPVALDENAVLPPSIRVNHARAKRRENQCAAAFSRPSRLITPITAITAAPNSRRMAPKALPPKASTP